MAAATPAQNELEFNLRELSPDDSVSGLSLGDAAFNPLKTFLNRDAKKHHQQNGSKTYVFVSTSAPKKVIAYVTLLCSHVESQTPPDGLDGSRFTDYPAIKIARLAVDRRFTGYRLGTRLIDFTIALAQTKIMPHIGCRFLVVDSKKQAINFYIKQGFRILETEANKKATNPVMFVDLGKLE